jgi:hypothetical protein
VVKSAEIARQAAEAAAPAPVSALAPSPASPPVAEGPKTYDAQLGRYTLGAAGGLVGAAGLQALLGAGLLTFSGGLALGIYAGLASAERYFHKNKDKPGRQ